VLQGPSHHLVEGRGAYGEGAGRQGPRAEGKIMGLFNIDFTGLGGITTVIDDILKMFPNAEQRAAAEAKIQDLVAQVAAAQSATNTEEAKSSSLFVAGWRPFIG